MRKILEQLTDYYSVAHGLVGDDLSAAVGADASRVTRNAVVKLTDELALCSVFHWGSSPEGRDYWEARNADA